MWGIANWGEMIWGGASSPLPLMSPFGFLVLAALLIATGVVMQRRHAPQWAMWTLGAVVILIPLAAYAGTIGMPYTFTNGTIADADEVNANFGAVETAVNDNDGRITTAQGSADSAMSNAATAQSAADAAQGTADGAVIDAATAQSAADAAQGTADGAVIDAATAQSSADAAQGAADANTPAIATNTTAIGSNATSIASNASSIADLAALDIAGAIDSRVSFTGTWVSNLGNWGANRFSDDSRITECSSGDCSAWTVTLVLNDNQHRTVMMSHMDWTNSQSFDVWLSWDGGANFTFHKSVDSNRTGGASPYISVIRTMASNLPLGADVQIRIVAAQGRLYFEGFALSKLVLPE